MKDPKNLAPKTKITCTEHIRGCLGGCGEHDGLGRVSVHLEAAAAGGRRGGGGRGGAGGRGGGGAAVPGAAAAGAALLDGLEVLGQQEAGGGGQRVVGEEVGVEGAAVEGAARKLAVCLGVRDRDHLKQTCISDVDLMFRMGGKIL